MYENSVQKGPKNPPPAKPPKTSVLGMANVPMVSEKKQPQKTSKGEVSKESANQGPWDHGFGWIWRFFHWVLGGVGEPNLPGRRTSSAKAWLDGSEPIAAPVEGQVPVPKFLM